MTDLITKGTPQVVRRGTKVVNERGAQRTAEAIPMHCPLIPIFAERGRPEPVWITTNSIQAFGSKTFDRNGPFWGHPNKLAEVMSGAGNMYLGIRQKPANAKEALFRLSAELIVADINVNQRSSDGSTMIEDTPNGPQPIVREVIIGTRVVLHRGVGMYQPDNRAFARGNVIDNYRDGATVIGGRPLGEVTVNGVKVATRSKLYPIHDLKVDSFGKYGDNVGISYGTPVSVAAAPIDVNAVEANKAYFYRVALHERPSERGTPVVQPTQAGELALDLTFKENTTYPQNGKPASITKRLIEAFQLVDDPVYPNEYGPFGESHVYTANIAQILTMLTSGYTYTTTAGDVDVVGEKAYDSDAEEYGRHSDVAFADPKNLHLFNFLTGADYNGVPYFAVDGANSHLYGGVSLANNAVQYASGGSDGLWYTEDGSPHTLINQRQFDESVRTMFENADALYQLGDCLRYPISAIWDSGYSMKTKLAAIDMLGLRPDIFVVTGTQSVIDDYGTVANRPNRPVYLDGDMTQSPEQANNLLGGWDWSKVNDDQTELSRGSQLKARYDLFPASAYFGTSTAYGFIVGHGEAFYNKDDYDGILPFTFDFAEKIARFAGGQAWVQGLRPNVYPNNLVTQFRKARGTYRKMAVANQFWDTGINYAQYVDTKGLFWPAMQTVYENDTAPLNSIMTMMAVIYAQRVAINVWKYLTGRDDLDDQQMIEESDRRILEEMDGRFDSGVSFRAESEILDSDREAGYIWRAKIHIYTNTMKTVGIFDVYSHRRNELVEAGVQISN